MPGPHAKGFKRAPTAARRAFFKAFLGDSPATADAFHQPLQAQQIALLKEVAAQWRSPLPRGALPRIEVSEACANHGNCAAVCPTGALRAYRAEAVAGLEFEPGACIACGVCAVVCPEAALSISPAAKTDTSASATAVLTRKSQRECTRCDNPFVTAGDEELCPACRKDVSLFAYGFETRSAEA
jgi:ferredoxin